MKNWFKKLFATRKQQTIRNDQRRNFRPILEALEARLTPATYTWNEDTSSLSISLASNENITVSENSSTVSFQLSQDTFTQNGDDTAPSGDGTATIAFATSDLTNSIGIGANTGATNDVTFDGGSISSGTIICQINPRTLGEISVTNGTSLSVTSEMELLTPENVSISGGSSLSASGSGTIIVTGNAQTTSSTGSFVGVDINDSTVETTGSGGISIEGVGGNSGTADGVDLNDAMVESTSMAATAGAIYIEGTGGASSSSSDGVAIFGGSVVSSASAVSQGDGEVTIAGSGGSGAVEVNIGVYVDGPGTQITSADGDIFLNGTGGPGTLFACYGVEVSDSALISSTGSTTSAADIFVAGTGGGSGGGEDNYGIDVSNQGEFSSVAGYVDLTATAGVGGSPALELAGSGEISVTGSSGETELTADSMDLSGTINVAGDVILEPETSGALIYAGSTPPAPPQGDVQLDLSPSQLAGISAGSLDIDSNGSGDVTVGSNLSFSVATDVELLSDDNVIIDGGQIDTDGGSLAVFDGGLFQPTQSGTDATASDLFLEGPLGIDVEGNTVDTDYTQLNVSGEVDLNNQALDLSGSYTPQAGDVFTIVSASSITGTFENLANGDTTTLNGVTLTINYTSTSVTLTDPIPVTGTYDLSDADDTLTINLDTSQNLTVTEVSGNVTFAVSSGTLTASGGDAADSGDGTDSIVIAASELASSVAINNANSASGFNSVTFSGNGSLTSATIDVSLTNSDAIGQIDCAGLPLATTGQIDLTANELVDVVSGSDLSASGSGSITLEANQQSQATSANFDGIDLANSTITTSGTGNIELEGTGGTTSGNAGIIFGGGAEVTSTDTATNAGKIVIDGAGGNTAGSGAAGIFMLLSGNLVTSVAGAIQITGQGGSAPNGTNYGIFDFGGTVSSTGTGSNAATISIAGTGGSAGGTNDGVLLDAVSDSVKVTSADGYITIDGTGGSDASGSSEAGVIIQSGAVVSSTGEGAGAANIAIDGTGGNGTTGAIGVDIASTDTGITAVDGTISINGTGGAGTSTGNDGVSITGGAVISSTGTDANAGGIEITGTGGGSGGSSDSNFGVAEDSSITSAAGSVSMSGAAGLGSSSAGITFGGARLAGLGADIAAGNGAEVTLAGDSIVFPEDDCISANDSKVFLQQLDDSTPIELGGTDADALDLSADGLDSIAAATLEIGNFNSGNVSVLSNITLQSATDVVLDSGGSVIISGGELDTDGGTLAVDGNGAFEPAESGTDVAASTLSLNTPLNININGTTVDTGYTQLNVSGTVDLSSTLLQLTGAYTPVAGDDFTIISATSISGTFDELANGATVNFNGVPLKIDYTPTAVTLSDFVPPTATVTTSPPAYINETSASAKTTTIAVTYASADSTINASTFGVDNISVSNGATVTAFKAKGDVVTYTITAPGADWGASFQGTYTISLNANVMDERGVAVVAGSDLASFIVDTALPTVTIGYPSLPATHSGPVTYTIAYSDADFKSSSLTAANVILDKTGTANGKVSVDDSTGSTRTVTISDITGLGTLSISLAAGTASDIAGNKAPAAGPSFTFRVTAAPKVFTVSNTDNGGAGSLRAAILDADANTSSPSLIEFSIGTGVQTIDLTSPLPAITETATIDGTTQPGSGGMPAIVIDGSSLPSGSNGLTLDGAQYSLIQGLSLVDFAGGDALVLESNVTVRNNLIGVMPNGTAGGSNIGIFVETNNSASGNGNEIGSPGDGNTIENNNAGISLIDTAANGLALKNNQILGNTIANNDDDGIDLLKGVAGDTIGGLTAAQGNVISGNSGYGVYLHGTGTKDNRVEGNLIGVNAADTAADPNLDGVELAGGASGNIIGGAIVGAGNTISGNAIAGVLLTGSGTTDNQVLGNLIGADADGAALSSGMDGVDVESSANGNIIGGSATGDGNVISGNGGNGVSLIGVSGTQVLGNKIGTDVAGTAALGNSFNGVFLDGGSTGNIIGGAANGDGNVISGNYGDGILIFGSTTAGNKVEGNLIGIASDGVSPLGNQDDGVTITSGANNNQIGGTAAGDGNVIAFNGGNEGDGVLVGTDTEQVLHTNAGDGNAIEENSIYENSALGIHLGAQGTTTVNDANGHTGVNNNYQNTPVLTSAGLNGASVVIEGSLTQSATPNTTFRIEFYVTSSGGSVQFLGFTTVTTNGSGVATFDTTITASVTAGELISATATDNLGNTSEFSATVTAAVLE